MTPITPWSYSSQPFTTLPIKLLFCIGLLGSLTGGLSSCSKLIDIEEPVSSIPQSKVFATDQEAISALSGAYYQLANTHMPTLLNGAMTIYPALSADELLVFDQGNTEAIQFNQNAITANNAILATNLWTPAYQSIYTFNAILENIKVAPTLSPQVKDQLTGHALFGRALLHFHLASLFEKIPLITSTDWRSTGTQGQATTEQIYVPLIADLQQAIQLLPEAYEPMQGGRLVANKYAAMVLLARIYAQLNDWEQVATLCDQVINSGLYSLAATPTEVYLINSPEVILQWQQDPASYAFNATREGLTLLPMDGIFPFPPFGYLSPSLLDAFETKDSRKQQWIRNRTINGITYYYPAKYKIGPSQAIPGAPLTEGYVAMRLAELYLLRAEARLMQGQTAAGMEDINIIRTRAGLDPLPLNQSPEVALNSLKQERRIELFCEWGNRWNDLKRWGNAQTALTVNKGVTMTTNSLVYPIPAIELSNNPGLKQHPGY